MWASSRVYRGPGFPWAVDPLPGYRDPGIPGSRVDVSRVYLGSGLPGAQVPGPGGYTRALAIPGPRCWNSRTRRGSSINENSWVASMTPNHTHYGFLIHGFCTDRRSSFFFNFGGPGGRENPSKWWGSKHPTFRKGVPGPRGRPDPQNRRFPVWLRQIT